jgi:hypothetical protein
MYSSRGWSYSSASNNASSAYRRRRLWPRKPRLAGLRFSPLPLAIVLVGFVAWYHFVFTGFSIAGFVIDDATGQPISGARLWSGYGTATTLIDGGFSLDGVKPPEVISVDAPGYRAVSLRAWSPLEQVAARLEPVSVEVAVADADTGLPVAAQLSGTSALTIVDAGRMRVAPVRPGQRFELSADGYMSTQVAYGGQDVLSVHLQPKVTGQVTDAATGEPIQEARVVVDDAVLMTGVDGGFELKRRPTQGQLHVLMPGYRRASLDLAQARGLDVQLQPVEVRAIYMTYFAIGGDEYVQEMNRLLDTTEINAVVIDLKGDYGLLSYRSRVPLAQQIGANDAPTIDDPERLLGDLRARGVYTIARIVVFKDSMLARNGPKAGLDVGVKDRRTGKLWSDLEEQVWVDPFQQVAWDYNTALAREAIAKGFDEVQFDYIRFPTDAAANSSVDDVVYSQPSTAESRVAALKNFLSRAHVAVNQAGGFLGMDTFGYTTWWDDEGGIGQDLAQLADNIDYYNPMIYPSTFNAGLPGAMAYPNVVYDPYEVVFRSLQRVEQKLAGTRVVIRPWLQYFDDYPWATKTRYDAPQIEAQKKAVADARSYGWMLWNAGSLFTRGGIGPKQ